MGSELQNYVVLLEAPGIELFFANTFTVNHYLFKQ